jgi:AraC-like DNA-binding protein/quercetin dioxygenase-like cupin family protein
VAKKAKNASISRRRQAAKASSALPAPVSETQQDEVSLTSRQDSSGILRLPGNQADIDWPSLGLPRLLSMGRSIFDPIWAIKDHASRGAELMFILRGQVTVHTADYKLPATQGQVVYTPRGKVHRDVFPLESEFEVYLVHFEWAGEDRLLSDVTPAQLTEASSADAAAIASDMRQLYADFLHHGPMTGQLTSLRLMQVICRLWHHVVRSRQSEPAASYDLAKARRVQIMTQARQVIHERFSQPLGLDDIAEAIDVSPYYLSRVFSQEAGFTLSSYLHDVRMEKAASLLRSPRMAVSDVARQVGFRDAHYFARVFKNHFGAAPSAYRVRMSPAGK